MVDLALPGGQQALNETLRRALIHARLSEEDVAAHLQVDPKTVRRWLEGRTPYLCHRWALAALLGLDEADLWPQLRTFRSRPEKVRAIYPHSGSIPQRVWQEFFQSAQLEIDILTDGEPFPVNDRNILGVLRERAAAGVKVPICLRAPDSLGVDQAMIRIHQTLARGNLPRWVNKVEIRLHRLNLQNSIYRVDDELIVVQRAFGISPSTTPALHLRGVGRTGLAATYLESFHSAWTNSVPLA